MFLIRRRIKKLPGKPGVYIMHGEKMRSFMWERRSV